MDKPIGLKMFVRKFPFNPARHGFVGIERERFLLDIDGTVVPRSPEFLAMTRDPAWTYELSACQVEDRTKPHDAYTALLRNLAKNDQEGTATAELIGYRLLSVEVGPENMPLDVYPGEPRYAEIAKKLSKEQLSAACRVAGTHIHYGVGSFEEAFRVYHALRENLQALCRMGDHSSGERLRLYRIVAPNCDPPKYDNLEHFFETARTLGFAENPRNCWHLLRITKHGTVECRVFGATEDLVEVVGWVETIKQLVR